jgi:hypothetical protein
MRRESRYRPLPEGTTPARRKATGENFHHIVNVGVPDLAKFHAWECLRGFEH